MDRPPLHPLVRELADSETLGAFAEALQTVNILKDVAVDAEKENSVYVPEELLRAHGSPVEWVTL